ncbi:hypothetical protein MLD38_026309 [Melastoma candidum]|uniref:Uncharacterized protein n=1 Tax=Melastoma candidum TaxID=119954 RepID=A0ACB9NY69_9MYRT|nr:hypothetical protein MLD38_026309 [Melastoma candidum]
MALFVVSIRRYDSTTPTNRNGTGLRFRFGDWVCRWRVDMKTRSKVWRWVLGLTYIVAVAVIWIAASFFVQSVVDAGVSSFLITYICNSLFVVYIPIVEIGRWVEDKYGSLLFWRKGNGGGRTRLTSNTILSSASSLFTFLVALVFLGEKFTWVKLSSVVLCMGGTIIVSLGDSGTTLKAIATDPLLRDILALVSSALNAVYITLIRVKLPDDEEKQGQASMAEFLGYIGLFNLLIFLPVALVLDFTKLEPFNNLTWQQFGLIVGKVANGKNQAQLFWKMNPLKRKMWSLFRDIKMINYLGKYK